MFLMLLAAAPTSQPDQQQISKWFNQLADSDADIRQTAEQNLMGMSADQLPLLKKVVENFRPLRPSQTAVLHDIFIHVWIANSGFDVDPKNTLMIGLTWSGNEHDTPSKDGLVVQQRVPGFSAFQMLRDGDRLIGIKEDPELAITDVTDLKSAITFLKFKVGDIMTLKIVRDGKSIWVPVQLRYGPAGINTTDDMQNWILQRTEEAETHWQQLFAPLLEDSTL